MPLKARHAPSGLQSLHALVVETYGLDCAFMAYLSSEKRLRFYMACWLRQEPLEDAVRSAQALGPRPGTNRHTGLITDE